MPLPACWGVAQHASAVSAVSDRRGRRVAACLGGGFSAAPPVAGAASRQPLPCLPVDAGQGTPLPAPGKAAGLPRPWGDAQFSPCPSHCSCSTSAMSAPGEASKLTKDKKFQLIDRSGGCRLARCPPPPPPPQSAGPTPCSPRVYPTGNQPTLLQVKPAACIFPCPTLGHPAGACAGEDLLSAVEVEQAEAAAAKARVAAEPILEEGAATEKR